MRRDRDRLDTLQAVSQGYQIRDAAIVDYRLWQLQGATDWLRGPQPPALAPGSYIACVGAAQTFGCFVETPWPQLLAGRLCIPTLNLGIAGAGPALFQQQPFATLLANARAVVFQVLSGRSADCSRFRSGGRERLTLRSDGRVLAADDAWREVLHADLAGWRAPLLRGLRNRWLGRYGRHHVQQLVQETQTDWLAQFHRLLAGTSVPKVLLWWSRRTPQHQPRFHSLAALFGDYPQLIDAPMVHALAGRCDAYVECVTKRGSPQLLRDRSTGEPTSVTPAAASTGEAAHVRWTHNAYYPSPEMHADAADALLEPLRQLLAQRGSAATRS